MNLNALLYVIEIGRCGSINRAAQNLYISQSNLSSTIKMLENELGYKIFNRTSKGIAPTPEGYLFLQSAKAIQTELEKIQTIPSRLHSSEDISISCTWSSWFLRNFMDFKAQNHPEIRDSYKETGLIQNFQDIQENNYRLALFYCFHSRTEHHQNEARRTNLAVELLAENIPAVVLVSNKHPLSRKESVTLEDIHSYPLVLFEDFEREDWKDILKISKVQQILYLFDRGSIVDILMSGDYISVIKKGTITKTTENQLVELPIADLNDNLDILLLKHKAYSLNNREKAFIRYLKKHMKL